MKNLFVLLSLLCFFNANSVAQSKSTGSKKRSISSSIKDSITTEKKNNTSKSILNSFYDDEGYLLAYEDLPNLKGYNPNKPILENEEEALNYILSNIDFVCNYNPGFYKSDILNFKIKNGKITNVDYDKVTIFKDSLFYKKIKLNQKSLPNFYIPIAYLYSEKLTTKRISTYQLEILHTNNKRYYDSITLKKEIKKNFTSGRYKALTSKELNLINRLNRTCKTDINPIHCIIEHNDYLIDTTKIDRQIKYGCYSFNEDEYRFKIIFNYVNNNKLHLNNEKHFEYNDIVFYNDSTLLTISKRTDFFRQNLSYSPIIIRSNNSIVFDKQDTIPGNYLIQNPLLKDSLIYIHSEFHRYENPFQLIKIESYKKVKTFRFGFF